MDVNVDVDVEWKGMPSCGVWYKNGRAKNRADYRNKPMGLSKEVKPAARILAVIPYISGKAWWNICNYFSLAVKMCQEAELI